MLTLCTFLVLVPLNLWTTVTSPSFVTYLGTGVADLRLELRTPEAVVGAADLVRSLEQDADVAAVAPLVTVRLETLDADGERLQLPVESGEHDVFPLSYVQGGAPTSGDEVAVSSLAADAMGAATGDVVDVRPARGRAGSSKRTGRAP